VTVLVATRRTARVPATQVDVGRLVLVPLFTGLLVIVVLAIPHAVAGKHGFAAAVAIATSGLTVAFYLLILWGYLRRGPASATATSWVVRTAAVVATCLPLVLPLLARPSGSVRLDATAGALMLAGLTVSVLALRALDDNLSVVPQARGLAVGGPYRWVRHPLYVGELVTVLGIAVREMRPAALALWVVLVALQVYRARAEEGLLGDVVPGYRAYRVTTARFVPGVY